VTTNSRSKATTAIFAAMPEPNFDVVLTLEARSNILLDVITAHFELTESQVFREITANTSRLRQLLRRKEIEYLDLKRALVPATDRNERAFFFDWEKFDGGGYGVQVMHCLLSVLDKRSSRSVLAGDWSARLRPSAALRESHLSLDAPIGTQRVEALPDTLYIIYLNNLTPSMEQAIDAAFATLPGYVGSADMTYASLFKVLLSTMLVRDFIQHRGVVLMGHEDDRGENEDYSLKMYDFANYNYKVRSVPSWLYGMFLSYKIERPVFDVDLGDSRFSLNAISPTPQPLTDCEVVLEPAKLEYLQSKKTASLKRANLAELDADAVAEQIRRKLMANYIYCMARSEDHSTLKFNIVLENGTRARSMCALEYIPDQRQVRLITFF
jgi:hypothetical protein